jgi:hypothetical protein
MSFDVSAYLRRATGRAKSDVANKLIGMLLHEVSRKLCGNLALGVSDSAYIQAVFKVFGNSCCYCGRALENDRAAVEHLDGMNRFRAGLHIPGNVLVACTHCNREKRRDDSAHQLILAPSGWESFLSHDSTRCNADCLSCAYWKSVWPDSSERSKQLGNARTRILSFRCDYKKFLELNAKARTKLVETMDGIYRDCQKFATEAIKHSVETVVSGFSEDKENQKSLPDPKYQSAA